MSKNIKDDLISIIIPTYNSINFIQETLESIYNQSYKNWEVIIVDDGSNDGTCEYLASNKDKRISFFKRDKTEKGASVCRNIGIKKAKGKYILFLDSDDLLLTDTLKNRLSIFSQNKHLDFIVYNTGFFFKKIGDSLKKKYIPKNKKTHLKKFILLEAPWYISGPLWKKEFLIKLGGFNENFQRFQDTELHIRALCSPNVKYNIYNETDVFYRIVPKSNAHHVKKTQEFKTLIIENLIFFQKTFTNPTFCNHNHLNIVNISKKLLIKIVYSIFSHFPDSDGEYFLTKALNIDNMYYQRSSFFVRKINFLVFIIKQQKFPIISRKMIYYILSRF